MEANTFTEALELAYAEVWRIGEEGEAYRTGIPEAVGDEGDRERRLDDLWREGLGAQKVLGSLLHARGEIGIRTFPARPDHELPDIQQTWIRLMQWAVRKGMITQEELDDILRNSPQLADAMEHLGQDRRAQPAKRLVG